MSLTQIYKMYNFDNLTLTVTLLKEKNKFISAEIFIEFLHFQCSENLMDTKVQYVEH